MKNTKIIYSLSSDADVNSRTHWVLQRDYKIEMFEDTSSILDAIETQTPDLIIVDTSSADVDVESLISQTKKDCGGCISYLLLSASTRRPFSSLFRCNCIVGQVNLQIIPDQLQRAVKEGMELSHMCQIRAKLFTQPLKLAASERIELVMQA